MTPPAAAPPPPYVFISYARHDDDLVTRLVAALGAADIPFWIDKDDIPKGHSYAGALTDAIESCAVFLLLLTDASDASRHVQTEVAAAFSSSRRILQVCVDAFEPRSRDLKHFLRLPQRLDVGAGLNEKDLLRITEAVRALLQLPPVPPPAPRPKSAYDSWRFWIPLAGFYVLSWVLLHSRPAAAYRHAGVVTLAFVAGIAIVLLVRYCNGLVLFTVGFLQPMLVILPEVAQSGGAALFLFDGLQPVVVGLSAAGGGCLTWLPFARNWQVCSWSDWLAWMWPRRRASLWAARLEGVLKTALSVMTLGAILWKISSVVMVP